MNGDKQKKFRAKNAVVCVVIALIVAIAGLVAYSEKVQKIWFIENIKQAIEEMINPSTTETDDVTTVDVTGILPGDVGNHVCSEYYISKYDETNHWNECKICGKEYDKVAHNLIDNGWSLGSANVCVEDNVHSFSCSCGYSYTNTDGRKSHYYIPLHNQESKQKSLMCNDCYYSVNEHRCVTANGKEVNCDNLGRCTICGYTWTLDQTWHGLDIEEVDKYYNCQYCNKEIVKILEKEVLNVDTTNNTMRFKISLLLPENSTAHDFGPNIVGFGAGSTADKIVSSTNQEDGTVITYEITVNFNEKQYMKGKTYIYVYCVVEGQIASMHVVFDDLTFDQEAPVINPINNLNSAEWKKNQEIIISGTENYCNAVTVEILDGEEVVYTGMASVINNNWSITVTPELEASIEGKNFTVRVTDTCENSSTQEINVSKVDAIAPELTDSDIVIGGD